MDDLSCAFDLAWGAEAIGKPPAEKRGQGRTLPVRPENQTRDILCPHGHIPRSLVGSGRISADHRG